MGILIWLYLFISTVLSHRRQNYDGFIFTLYPYQNAFLRCPSDRFISITQVKAFKIEHFRKSKANKDVILLNCTNWENIYLCSGRHNCGIYLNNCFFSPFTRLHGTYNCVIFTASLTTKSLDSRKLCNGRIERGIYWEKTLRGVKQIAKCPYGQIGNATWTCSEDDEPVWIGVPNLSNCSSINTNYLINMANGLNNLTIPAFAQELESSSLIISNGKDIDALVNIIGIAAIRGNDISSTNSASLLANSFVSSANNILNVEKMSHAWNEVSNVHLTANNLFIAFDSATYLFARINEDTSYVNEMDNIYVSSKLINNLDILMNAVNFEIDMDTNFHLPTQNINLENYDVITSLIVYKNLGDYLNCLNCDQTINSDVASFSISKIQSNKEKLNEFKFTNHNLKDDKKEIVKLEENIVFTLRHSMNLSHLFAHCVFWDFNLQYNRGIWSSKGCKVVSSNLTHTTCSCSHLTSFAILMSPTAPQMSYYDDKALTIITYIGCVTSIICLFLSFIAFNICRNLTCDRNSIHKNLVINLLVANLIFIIGIDLTQIQILCTVIAAFLYYFLLTSFVWMLAEGVQLYFMLIEIFESEKSRMRYYYPIAYGFPALLLGISMAIFHEGFGTLQYCWLTTERGFIWAFLAPVLIIILVNFVMLGVAIKAMHNHLNSKVSLQRKDLTILQQIKIFVRGAFVLVFLLGSTWIFGIFYFNGYTIIFAYVFTIINSFQGLFIFIFHVVLNEKIQKDICKKLVKCSCLPEYWRQKLDVSSTISSSKINSNEDKVKLKKVRKKSTNDSGLSSEDATGEKEWINSPSKTEQPVYVPKIVHEYESKSINNNH